MLCDDKCCETAVQLQSQKHSKLLYRPPCKPVAVPIDSNTIYKKSYTNANLIARESLRPTNKILKYGDFDMNTVYNMTYQWTPIIRREIFHPKPRLIISKNPMEMISNHMSSYCHPGIIKPTSNYRQLFKDNCKVMIPMETVTTTNSAYTTLDNKLTKIIKNKIQYDKCKWPSNFKPNYDTNYRDSYQHYKIKPINNYRPCNQNGLISSKMNCTTIYRMSY